MTDNNKPLADWTLGQVKTECRGLESCVECRLYDNGTCRLYTTHPANWDLADKPRFSCDELATLRVLYAAGVRKVQRNERGDIILSRAGYEGDTFTWNGWGLPPDMFPAIRHGQSVNIREIIQKGE